MSVATTADTLLERRTRVFGAGAPLFYDAPLTLVRGEGAHVFDASGRRYLDLYNNVPVVGHANPHVAEAVGRAQATLNTHSRYLHEGVIEFAERFVGLHHDGIESIVFTCSGTEANEVALRMARFATGRRGIVCSNATYHGNSELVGALSRVGRQASPPEDIRAFPFPDPYRPLRPALNDEALLEACLEEVREAIRALAASPGGFAALIVCPLFANEGLPRPLPGFLARAAALARAAGGLVIADEVQAGYGRSGRWWGYEASGFIPDIVVTGKPMGNGVPLAAAAASRRLVEAFRGKTRYFNTFASSPLQAAAGMAVLDVIEREGLIAHAAAVGAELEAALAERTAGLPRVGEVRARGLFVGLDMVEDPESRRPAPKLAAAVCNRLKDKGFLTAPAGAAGNVVKVRPPLVIARADALTFVDAFEAVMRELDG
ncbi:MAG TPA: aminotransferase class III-fold pyridoxal phosphate-dependent enzyme [Caulobacteraceae bacterium]|nr:aminotransferase class III-fold pyridoxal phosphate-dependent enzyme [Caulobacteraceae bacterium]